MPKPFRCRLSFMGGPEQEGTAVLQDGFIHFTSADGKTRTLINHAMLTHGKATYNDDTVEFELSSAPPDPDDGSWRVLGRVAPD